MIAYLSGKVLSKNLRFVLVDVSGVGYRVQMPLSDLSRLGEEGNAVGVHIHTHVREDAFDLFGFLDIKSLILFELLIGVSGIGPKLALTLLSGMSAADLSALLLNNDHISLTKVPGIGKKTAQRLVLELKDKVAVKENFVDPKTKPSSVLSDLRSAIENLGYKSQTVEKAVKSVEPLAKEGLTLESLVKEALKQLNA